MTATDRLQLAGLRLRDQQARMRAGRLDRRNDRLRRHVDVLQTELDREREGREELLDLMRKEGSMSKGRGGAMKLLIVGGVAYVLGAKAGRQRYDQIVGWARSMKAKGEEKVDQLREERVDLPEPTTERPASASLGVTTRSAPASAGGA